MDPYNSADARGLPAGGAGAMPPPAGVGNASNPYAAPGAVVRDVHDEGDIVLASRLSRLGAALLDSAIIVVPAIVAAISLPAYQDYVARSTGAAPAAGGMSAGMSIFLVLCVVAMLAFFVYQLVLLYRHGQTVGKKIVGIRIVRPDGSRASFPRLLGLRYIVPGLIGAIPLLGPFFSLANVLFIFGEERRCLHDRIADTIVVNT